MNLVPAGERAVIIMAKRPAPGFTKTRLSPALNPQDAADLYECFLIDTLTSMANRSDCTVIIAIDIPDSADYFSALAPGLAQVQQVGEGLGQRLDAVMSQCLDDGFEHVFALASDSPDLPPEHLDAAFEALADPTTDLVFGPSDDGGYYLIGWKARWSLVVTDVTMSAPTVLRDSLAIAANLGLSAVLAPTWYDVDDSEDLERLKSSLGRAPISATSKFLAER